MSALPMPDHLLGLDEWAALPEDNSHHYELIEGVLQVSPRPALMHKRALGKLYRQLDEQLPADLVALLEIEMVVTARWPATVRAPDLAVVSAVVADADPVRCDAADVQLAVDVISPGSRELDQATKMYEYSEAGIPNYWILDLDGQVTMTAYRLIDGEYEIVGKGTDAIPLTEPAPVTIDVAALLPHRS